VLVEVGDREGLEAPVELLRAETRHCCVRRDSAKPERLPMEMVERLCAVRDRPPAI